MCYKKRWDNHRHPALDFLAVADDVTVVAVAAVVAVVVVAVVAVAIVVAVNFLVLIYCHQNFWMHDYRCKISCCCCSIVVAVALRQNCYLEMS